MQEPKEYCPFCKFELSGNTHKDDIGAWVEHNCEFNKLVNKEPPISELEMKTKELKYMKNESNVLRLKIQNLSNRILELNNIAKSSS